MSVRKELNMTHFHKNKNNECMRMFSFLISKYIINMLNWIKDYSVMLVSQKAGIFMNCIFVNNFNFKNKTSSSLQKFNFSLLLEFSVICPLTLFVH